MGFELNIGELTNTINQYENVIKDFESCIKRSAGEVALTNDDTGIISLQYGEKFPINNNVSECTNDYYRKMN